MIKLTFVGDSNQEVIYYCLNADIDVWNENQAVVTLVIKYDEENTLCPLWGKTFKGVTLESIDQEVGISEVELSYPVNLTDGYHWMDKQETFHTTVKLHGTLVFDSEGIITGN